MSVLLCAVNRFSLGFHLPDLIKKIFWAPAPPNRPIEKNIALVSAALCCFPFGKGN